MRFVSSKEIENVLRLSGPKRYSYFIKFICDVEKAWGLYEDGWVLMGDNQNKILFPIWPAKIYAQLCILEGWKHYQPRAIPLEDLTSLLIPSLIEDNKGIAIFPTPENQGVLPTFAQLQEDLNEELSKY